MFVLQVLGPLVLAVAGKPLALPTAKVAALLALLALEGPAPRERIAAWLWPQQDAAGSRRNLRRELARLREIGAGDVLVARGETLALSDAVESDSARFAALLEQAQIDAALALWRGVPADGLSLPDAPAFDDWLAGARTRLARRRTAALETSAAAHEHSGDLDGALRAIQLLLDDDPLQETHQRSAMRLHAAAGRRAAALAGYERFAALLASELGLAPMADTVALMQTLRQPAGAAAGAGAAVLPTPAPRPPRGDGGERSDGGDGARTPALPATLPFVGREAELAQLDAAWQQGLAVVIEGPAGIGKTRLATEFVAARGPYALAPCRPGDEAEPYAAFTRALRGLAGQALAATDWPHWLRDDLAHLLPELGPARQRIDSDAARERFFDACAEAWQWLAADSFDAVVVDDWHLADAPSRALFGHIVQRRRVQAAGGPREFFVGRPRAWAEQGIDALVQVGHALVLSVPALSGKAVSLLAERLVGAAVAPTLGPQLVAASAGNPFVAGETLRHWISLAVVHVADDGRWSMATQAAGGVAGADNGHAQAIVRARFAALPEAAVRLLEAAALAQEPFVPAHLARACALDEVQALAAIEAALAAQLLRERDGGFAFMHDLVHAAIESTLTPERRRLVHRRLALGAEALQGPQAPTPALIARHWEEGGETTRAVAHRLKAAEAALALYEDALAESHWAQALADGPTLAQRIEIVSRRAGQQRHRDDRPALEVSIAELHALAEQAAQHPETADAGLDARIKAADLLSMLIEGAEALRRIDAVLLALDGHHSRRADDPQVVRRRAHALQVRSQALNVLERPEEGAQAAEQALACGGLSIAQQGQLLHSMVYSCFVRGEIVAAQGYAERSLVLWQSIGLRRSVARAHGNLALLAWQLGRQAEARQQYVLALAMAREMRMHEFTRETLFNAAWAELHEGAPALALQMLDEAWNVSSTFTQRDHTIFIRGMQVQGHWHLGQLGAALDLAEDAHRRAVELGDTLALADCVSMTLDPYSDLADFERADVLVESLRGVLAAVTPAMRLKLGFNLAHLALARGRLDEAAEELALHGAITAMKQPFDRGYAALRHAELALARGDAAAALALLDRWQPETTHVEAVVLMQAARLDAHAALQVRGGHPATAQRAACDQARALLADPRTPAVAALALRRALIAASPLPMACAGQQRLLAEQAAQVQRLAAALAGRPQDQARLIERWSPR